MTKEQVLEELKSFIRQLILSPNGIDKELGEKAAKLKVILSTVNSCDCDWLSTEYGRWMREDPEVQEAINERKILLEQIGIKID